MTATNRDYALLGRDAALASRIGLASAAWYHTDIPRAQMKELMKRSDQPAIRDTVIWLGALILSGGLGVWFWGSWWCVPFFAVYGVLYGSASDSRWHECGHGTAFRTAWMNDAVYQLACFMVMRNPVTWRWSHTRHHTDTIIVGHDPEIVAMRPADLVKLGLNFVGIPDVIAFFGELVRNAAGRMTPQTASYIPEQERPRVFLIARIWLGIYAAVAVACLATGSILPAMLIGLPRLYGCWHMLMTGVMQHLGLAENVLDHRLNSRTVMMNPVSRFIYWNMNYHVEHHMFPMVPYHALPRLHALIRDDLPPAQPSILSAYREIIPAVLKQFENPDWFVKRTLPPTAKPYRAEFHGDLEPGEPTPGIGAIASLAAE
jgi:fatty acid desaturase